jgi:hypothetical protein
VLHATFNNISVISWRSICTGVVACVKQIVYIIVLYISGAKEGDVSCCLCQTDGSDKPNEIVLCDNCGLGMYIQ